MPSSEDSIDVVCVDDNASLADLTATFLERHDDVFDARAETDAKAVLERLEGGGGGSKTAESPRETEDETGSEQSPIDCIVSDYDMPDIDGIEFLEAVRTFDSDIPFILFTGKGSEEIASEAISADVTDYLQKQASTDQYLVLANRVRNAVESYRAQRALEDSELLFDAIFEDPTTLIGVLEPDGTLTNANRTALEFVGATRSELQGEPFWELPWWNHSEELQANVWEWIRRAADGEYVEYEGSHYDVDDERVVISGTIRPVTRGDDVVALIAEGRPNDAEGRDRIRL
ncbi:response regulator [Halobacteria archaeon AArc-m2/3/4]|uniref:Response regulator n=1 Tax=Natronoglomus mannanivorans TaxID=2979990 RepID=A0ABT2QJM2_9EURY|nr:response regulator [Halobacteria archaeon AArc-m2/3/4]